MNIWPIPCHEIIIRISQWPFSLISGDDIKTEAWILRNLVTVLAGAARRPHVPRSPEMRTLFRAIGIDVPENVATEEDAGSLAAYCILGPIIQHPHIYKNQRKMLRNSLPNFLIPTVRAPFLRSRWWSWWLHGGCRGWGVWGWIGGWPSGYWGHYHVYSKPFGHVFNKHIKNIGG